MSEGNGRQQQSPVVVGIACAVLLGYGGVTWFLFRNVGVPSETWTRYTFLLGGIEAIAFAAVGYLFGKEVHRQQAEKAEKRAQDAQVEVAAVNKRAVDVERKGPRFGRPSSDKGSRFSFIRSPGSGFVR